MNKRILAASCSLLLATAVGCTARPRVEAVRPSITSIDLRGIDLALEVDISNPYPMSVRAPKYHYALDISETEFVKGGPLEASAGLPARGTGTIIVPARVEYLQLWQAYQGLKTENEAPYKIHGAVNVPVMNQSFEVPFAHEGKFPILRPPGCSVRDVRMGERSMSRVVVEVEAELRNPNAFPLGVKGLGYTLRLGEINVGNVSADTPDTLAPGQSGKLILRGEVSGLQAVQQVVAGQSLGKAKLTATGSIGTPYGAVELPR